MSNESTTKFEIIFKDTIVDVQYSRKSAEILMSFFIRKYGGCTGGCSEGWCIKEVPVSKISSVQVVPITSMCG